MNKYICMGRLVRDPETRYTPDGKAVSHYTLAVDKRFKQDGKPDADFIPVTAFGKLGEHAEKYYKKGIKVIVTGRIETDSYEKDGKKVYTWGVVAEEQEFAEGKNSNSSNNEQTGDGFMNISEGMDQEMPFN